MSYEDHIKNSAIASAVIHLALLAILAYRTPSDSIGVLPEPKPIALNLAPRIEPEVPEEAESKKPWRLVDPGAAADTPVTKSELVSSHDTKAQSTKASEGDSSVPAVERVDPFEELGRMSPPGAAAPVQTPAVAPIDPVKPETPEPAEPAPAEPEEPTPAEPAKPEEPIDRPVQVAALPRTNRPSMQKAPTLEPEPEPDPLEPEPPKPEAPKEEAKEAVKMAQAAQPPMQAASPPVQEFRATRGRESGGAELGGITSFEAKQHELGAYMLEVRTHVEREWLLALGTRYPGSGRARALLDCSIRPDGTLEYVRIVDGGESPGFATLCKAAVERAAAHFKPFPFEVPDIYRLKNLEVRWQFTYM